MEAVDWHPRISLLVGNALTCSNIAIEAVFWRKSADEFELMVGVPLFEERERGLKLAVNAGLVGDEADLFPLNQGEKLWLGQPIDPYLDSCQTKKRGEGRQEEALYIGNLSLQV